MLTFKQRLEFWTEYDRRECEYAREDNDVHSFARTTQWLWVLLIGSLVVYAITSDSVGTTIRVSGAGGSLLLLILYVNRGRHPDRLRALRRLRLRIKSLLPLSREDLGEIRKLSQREIETARGSGCLVVPLFLVAAYIALKVRDLADGLMTVGCVTAVIALVYWFVRYTGPLCARVRDGSMTSARCKRVLAYNAYDYLTSAIILILYFLAARLALLVAARISGPEYEEDYDHALQALAFIPKWAVVLMALVALLMIVVPPLCAASRTKIFLLALTTLVLGLLPLAGLHAAIAIGLSVGVSVAWSLAESRDGESLRTWMWALVLASAVAGASVAMTGLFEALGVREATPFGLTFGVFVGWLLDEVFGLFWPADA